MRLISQKKPSSLTNHCFSGNLRIRDIHYIVGYSFYVELTTGSIFTLNGQICAWYPSTPCKKTKERITPNVLPFPTSLPIKTYSCCEFFCIRGHHLNLIKQIFFSFQKSRDHSHFQFIHLLFCLL